jgi:DNA-binding transcriptional LysR family regulator
MELRALRYFLAVADMGSVSSAARALHMTQPSLSRQLRQLEQELGLGLFARSPGALALTPAGREFVGIAQDLVNRANAALNAASLLAAGRLEHVTIAAPATTATEVVAPFLAGLDPDDPFPSVQTASPDRVFDTLKAGADLALATEVPPSGYAQTLLAVFPLWGYVRADHAWADRDVVDLGQLRTQTVLLLPRTYKPRQLLDQALEDQGIALRATAEANSPDVAQALAAAGRGIAIVSDEPRFDLHRFRLRTHRRDLTLKLYAAWEQEHHAAAALSQIARRISEFCVERYGAAVAAPSGPEDS